MPSEHKNKILLDTSFLIRLFTANDPLHVNAEGYYRRFIERGDSLYVSTITISEYCRRADLSLFPFDAIRIVPFNYNDALTSGRFANACLSEGLPVTGEYRRPMILNDINLFAQAQEIRADYFATSDSECKKTLERIRQKESVCFEHLDIKIPYSDFYGELPL